MKIQQIALFRFPFPFAFLLALVKKEKGEKEEKKKGSSIYRYYLYFSSESESRPREEDRSLSRDGERSSKGSFLLLSSLAKLTTGTKCVTTILVVYLFLPGVTLILINLSFFAGPVTLARPHLRLATFCATILISSSPLSPIPLVSFLTLSLSLFPQFQTSVSFL